MRKGGLSHFAYMIVAIVVAAILLVEGTGKTAKQWLHEIIPECSTNT